MSSHCSGISHCPGCLKASTLYQLRFSRGGPDLAETSEIRATIATVRTCNLEHKEQATHQGPSACAADSRKKQPPQQGKLLQPDPNSIQQQQAESQCVPPFLLQRWTYWWRPLPRRNKNHTGQKERHKSVPFDMLSVQKSSRSQQTACRTDENAQ